MKMYATFTISGEAIRKRAEEDRALEARMNDLSDKHKTKAWKRIQAHRWYRMLQAEVEDLLKDLTTFFA